MKRTFVKFLVLSFLLITIIFLTLHYTKEITKNSVQFLDESFLTIVEGEYTEKSFVNYDIGYLFMSEQEKQTIIKAARALVDTQYYEIGSTLYQLRIGFSKLSMEVSVEPLYELNISEKMGLQLNSAEPQEEFINRVIDFTKENYEYEVLGDIHQPLSVFFQLKYGQCYNFAEMFYLLAKEQGLNVRIAVNAYHAWNLVEINGEWKEVDLTLYSKTK